MVPGRWRPVWARVVVDRVVLSGHGAVDAAGAPAGPFGRVPGEVSLEDAQASARSAGLALLGALRRAVGNRGRHARTAIGAPALPLNLPVVVTAELVLAPQGNRTKPSGRRSGMRLPRVLLAIGLGAALFALDTPAADADCSSPTIEYPAGPVDRGQAITVTGSAFGDNCYDTGPPPPGQGGLGRPRDGIEIVITQAGDEHLVAQGGADAEYGFEVDVVVPADLEPGEARLQARVADPTGTVDVFDRADQPLLVSDAAPPSAEAEVAIFGPAAGPSTGPSDTEPPGSGDASAEAAVPLEREPGPGLGPWVVGALVVLGVVAGGSMLVVRRR